MAKIKVKALINSVRDEKLIKIGEVFEIEESEKERLLKHEAIEIVVEDIIEESLVEDGAGLKNEDPSIANKNEWLGVNPVDGTELKPDDESEITLEEIKSMTVDEIEALAKENNIELTGKLKAEKAQELFDKLGEE